METVLSREEYGRTVEETPADFPALSIERIRGAGNLTDLQGRAEANKLEHRDA